MARSHRYGWDARRNGLALAVTGMASAIVQAGLVGRATDALGERRASLIGLGFGVAGFVVYAVGPTDVSVWIAIPIAALWGLYAPAAQTLMTRRVAANRQGELQGALSSLDGISALISPPLFTSVFAAAVERRALLGAPFYLAALMLVLGIVAVARAATAGPSRPPRR